MSSKDTKPRVTFTDDARRLVRSVYCTQQSLKGNENLSNNALYQRVLNVVNKDEVHGHVFQNISTNTIKQIVARSSSTSKKRGAVSVVPAVIARVEQLLAARQLQGYGVLPRHLNKLVSRLLLIYYYY
jgi:hypothetical protein